MKRLNLFLIMLFIAIVIFTGCTKSVGNTKYEINVCGTTGLKFSGHYIVTTVEGQSASKLIDGIVPTRYFVTGDIVSVVLQKQDEIGTLRVQIIRDGEIINNSETKAMYSVVSVTSH